MVYSIFLFFHLLFDYAVSDRFRPIWNRLLWVFLGVKKYGLNQRKKLSQFVEAMEREKTDGRPYQAFQKHILKQTCRSWEMAY